MIVFALTSSLLAANTTHVNILITSTVVAMTMHHLATAGGTCFMPNRILCLYVAHATDAQVSHSRSVLKLAQTRFETL